jgi:hypothetical protein
MFTLEELWQIWCLLPFLGGHKDSDTHRVKITPIWALKLMVRS